MLTPGRTRWLLLLAVVLALEAVCRAGLVGRITLIAPTEMALSAWRIVSTGRYASDIGATLATVAGAALLAVTVGFALGYLLYRLPRLRRAADPFLASYYAVPTFVFYPLLIVAFGLNRGALVALGFIFAVVAMALSALAGFERVPRSLRRTAKALRMSPWAEVARVTVPASAPYLCTGLKLAVAYSFIGVIAGEFVLAGSGLGFRIAFAYNNFDSATMYGLMLLLLGFVITLNAYLYLWEKRMHRRWGFAP